MKFERGEKPRDFSVYSSEETLGLAKEVKEIVSNAEGNEIPFHYKGMDFLLTYVHENQSHEITGDAVFSQATDGTWNIYILGSLSDIEVKKRLYHLIRQCELRKMNMPLTRILEIADSETESAFT